MPMPMIQEVRFLELRNISAPAMISETPECVETWPQIGEIDTSRSDQVHVSVDRALSREGTDLVGQDDDISFLPFAQSSRRGVLSSC